MECKGVTSVFVQGVHSRQQRKERDTQADSCGLQQAYPTFYDSGQAPFIVLEIGATPTVSVLSSLGLFC